MIYCEHIKYFAKSVIIQDDNNNLAKHLYEPPHYRGFIKREVCSYYIGKYKIQYLRKFGVKI